MLAGERRDRAGFESGERVERCSFVVAENEHGPPAARELLCQLVAFLPGRWNGARAHEESASAHRASYAPSPFWPCRTD